MERGVSLLGIFVFLLLAWALGPRRRPDKNMLLWGLGLQIAFAILVLGIPSLGFTGPLRFLFDGLNVFVTKILDFSLEGSRFVFGPLADPAKTGGFVFAVTVLPTIIFFSALVSVLYYLGIMQKIVQGVAWVMIRTMRASGAESLASAANIFLGQTEAPLAVKPYIPTMTRSELFAVMVGGMANVAGGVLAAYVGLLRDRLPDIAGHLITVSVMTAPGSILIAKLMVPEVEKPATAGDASLPQEQVPDKNAIEAAARGAGEGLQLALNVGAMLVAFIALVAMVNAGLGWAGEILGYPALSLQKIFSWAFAPVAWLMGVPWSEAPLVASFLGEKVALNEFVAYISLTNHSQELSNRGLIIASYALCGFANFSSIGIQIGGIGAMAPERRSEIAQLGIKALIAGSLSTFLAAAIAGLLI